MPVTHLSLHKAPARPVRSYIRFSLGAADMAYSGEFMLCQASSNLCSMSFPGRMSGTAQPSFSSP